MLTLGSGKDEDRELTKKIACFFFECRNGRRRCGIVREVPVEGRSRDEVWEWGMNGAKRERERA